ncbi:hypothetical protein HK405_010662 [Cladochytrium tenue]|nr:hypothetical protein HK405_010662 [Cladochytrium tenue]
MGFSMLYHASERTYRGHRGLDGPRILPPSLRARLSPEGEERLLLALDRALSVLALGATLVTCTPRAVLRVASAPATAAFLPAAVACAAAGELLHPALGPWAYSILHGAWHVLVYHLPYACVVAARDEGVYLPNGGRW